MARRGKANMPGQIKRRNAGSWTVIIDMGNDPASGRRRQIWRSVRGTKRQAQELLTELLHQRDNGIDIPSGRATVATFLEYWLANSAKLNCAPATVLQYQWAVRKHLVPAFGSVALTKLRPGHVQALYGKLNDGGLTARSILHIHRVLKAALTQAVAWQMLATNPAAGATPPRPERYEPPVLSPADVRRLLTSADEEGYGPLIHTAVMTGLRRGELQGLRWTDVSQDDAVLYVRQAAQWLPHKGWTFRQPKTSKSRRGVALGPETLAVLRRHRLSQAEARLAVGVYEDHGLVFASPFGTPIDPSHLRRVWARIVKNAELPDLHFHDCRHVSATLALQAGINPKVVSERLGHSSVGLTLDTYSSVLPTMQAGAAEAVEQLVAVGK